MFLEKPRANYCYGMTEHGYIMARLTMLFSTSHHVCPYHQ